MKTKNSLLLLIVLFSLSITASAQRRVLVWADEFNGPVGTLPDPAKWGYDLGTGSNGWGNNEWQTYTNRPQNASLDGEGNLVIQALAETFAGVDGKTRFFTSARLVTRGIFEPRYGRIEARLKLPYGQGIWPAFWMLGADIGTVGWPACGEIDIMENIGREPSIVHSSLHGPRYSGGSPLTGSYTLPNNARFADDFHVFAVEWGPRELRFFIDDLLYHTRTSADMPTGGTWAFDRPFYILLNLAVGGNWPGYPDATTVLPQRLLVDYVRVYQDPNPGASPQRGNQKRTIQIQPPDGQ